MFIKGKVWGSMKRKQLAYSSRTDTFLAKCNHSKREGSDFTAIVSNEPIGQGNQQNQYFAFSFPKVYEPVHSSLS